MRDPVGELVARRRVRDPRRHRQHLLQERAPVIVAAQVVRGCRPVEQVLEVRLRLLELGGILPARAVPDEGVRVVAAAAAPPRSPGTLPPPAARTTAPPRPGRRRRGRSSARPSTRTAAAAAPAGASAPCRTRPPPAAGTPAAPARSRNSPRPAPRSPLPEQRLRQVQAVQRPALRVDGRLGRVQVLRHLVRLHRPAAERHDRPRSRAIGIISRFRNRSTTWPLSRSSTRPLRSEQRRRNPCASRWASRSVPRRRRVAEAQRLDGLGRHAAALELLAGARAGRRPQLLPEPRRRDLVDLQQRLALPRVRLVPVRPGLRDRQAELAAPAAAPRRGTPASRAARRT